MAKFDAVDRLMTLATEKRADRTPAASSVAPAAGEAAERQAPATSLSTVPIVQQEKAPVAPEDESPTGAARARHLFETLRPFLPAVAGAMRLVDHGAVQALAKILPLLSGGGVAGVLSPKGAVTPAPEPWLPALKELQSSHVATRKDLDALMAQTATTEDLLGRTRTRLERVAAEQSARESELRALSDRVRLLSAGVIILLMLIVALMILLVVMLNK